MTEDEKLVAELLDMTQVFDPQKRRVTASAISRLTAEARELRATLSDIIKADDAFRASIPATADRDPVTLACDRARAALKPDPNP